MKAKKLKEVPLTPEMLAEIAREKGAGEESFLSQMPMPAYGIKDQLEDVLSQLTWQERQVLGLRFGLLTGKTETIKEIAKKLNITPGKVKKIEAKGIRKMRTPGSSKKLADYIE